jgi:hypothetical protein
MSALPIMATAREPIEQVGYISATSDIQQKSFLRNAAGPYIRVIGGYSPIISNTTAIEGQAVAECLISSQGHRLAWRN